MKHLELHILQSVPFSCLNRDELGSPKTGFFGGVKRARVSSQCWKRAIRLYAKEIDSVHFKGCRTRCLIVPLKQALEVAGLNGQDAEGAAKLLAGELVKLDEKNPQKVKTLFYTSPLELEKLAQAYVAELSGGADKKAAHKAAVKQLKKVLWSDAADIALFGRMVASDSSLGVEGAAMFSHALSTHRVDSELDFYSAVDDIQIDDESAEAGMIGTLEFVSATYYRFAAINLDMLADANHLGALTSDERQSIVRAFLKAVIMAVPTAKQNSMNGNTVPVCVRGIVREKGHPIQLVNAFEQPVRGGQNGIVRESVAALKKEADNLKSRWGLDSVEDIELSEESEMTLPEFIGRLAAHVC